MTLCGVKHAALVPELQKFKGRIVYGGMECWMSSTTWFSSRKQVRLQRALNMHLLILGLLTRARRVAFGCASSISPIRTSRGDVCQSVTRVMVRGLGPALRVTDQSSGPIAQEPLRASKLDGSGKNTCQGFRFH